ncbi:IS5 family transposase [Actinomycetospora chibensis]|nr:IS5 family transposase [Actinomycetospora chibensis]MDD7926489.1 IS5 family transposase [Actinomycetospora chibensis]
MTQGAPSGSIDDPCWVEPDHHAIGRSRGGLTTKLHMLTDGRGRPLVLLLTPGNVNDCPTFPQLIEGLRVAKPGPGRPRTRPYYVLGDKGYSSRANRELLRRRGIPHTIPEPRDQQANRARRGSRGGRPVGFDKQRYQRRNVVERGFNQLKQWRGIASRTDKHAINYRGAVTFRATLAWLS